MSKTNFLTEGKRDMETSLNISNSDGSSHALEQKQCIKYLGVMIDKSLTWKYHIAFVRISRNIGIISKLRYCLSIQQLKQIYYYLIYPYISYSILAWGCVYKTHIKTIQVKQNSEARIVLASEQAPSEV